MSFCRFNQKFLIRITPLSLLPERLVCSILWLYQKTIGPMTQCCRYQPSCSRYMQLAIQSQGLCHGIYLGVCRILRCHPFSRCPMGQIDYPPNK